MASVTALLSQLSPNVKAAGLGIAVSVLWPIRGPVYLYGADAVAVSNQCGDAVELQDYSCAGTPADVQCWMEAGVQGAILMGGVCTENSHVQTSLDDTVAWTTFALQHQLRGMFSWRLDNDRGRHGVEEDVDPTFTGAAAIYNTVQNVAKTVRLATSA